MMSMGDEADRREFLQKLFAFMDESGTPMTSMPLICKHTIDLYKLYNYVKELGGLQEVGMLLFLLLFVLALGSEA